MADREPDATLAIFRRLPTAATESLKDRTKVLAGALAKDAAKAGRGAKGGAQGPLVAPSVRARRADVPVVSMGGSALVGRNEVPVFKVMWGSEFGSNHLPQFRPHVGPRGYWFFKTLLEDAEPYTQMWHKVADELARIFEGSGTLELRIEF